MKKIEEYRDMVRIFSCKVGMKMSAKCLSYLFASPKVAKIIFFSFSFYLLFLDRFLKFLAVNDFFNEPIEIFGNIFQLNFIPNFYIAFSIPLSGIWLNVIIILIIISLIAHLYTSLRLNNYRYISYLALIIFGAVSNLYDRLKYGFVIDYFDLKYFTIFNIADAMIFFGALGVIIVLGPLSKK